MGENPFQVKTYNVDGREYTMRPLSFFEVLEMPELFVGVVERFPEGAEITASAIAFHAKGEIQGLLCRVLEIEPEEMKGIPADVGMQMVADFMEVNLNENFTRALGRTVDAGRRIYSGLVKS
jgi:hypothetical protein